jgi:DNA-binding MurR/RpiR family transcriptional regulator
MADSKGHGEKLTRKAEQAIAALLEHPTIAEAARACGVSERSLLRWLQRPDFQKRYREAQRAIVDGAIGELQAATVEAVKTLRRNLNCGNAFAENSAAQAVLTHSLKALEMQELQQRLEALEERIATDRDKKKPRSA